MLSHNQFFNIPVFSQRGTTIMQSLIFICLICGAGLAFADQTKSKRIEVYSLSQNFWDVQYGETLSSIVHHLLPNNPTKREALQQDILHLNPNAFIAGQPESLLAEKRLWLPGYMKQADSKIDPATTDVETYSWGNIKRLKK